MREFEKKKLLRKYLYSKFSIILLLLIILLLARGAWKAYDKSATTRASASVIINELEEVKKNEKTLEKEIELLKTADGIDAEIRRKFKAVKPGEEMSVIIEN